MLHLRPLGQLSVYVIPHFFQKLLERTDGKNNKIFNFRTGENPEFTGILSGANSQLYKKFRVRTLQPLGYICIYQTLILYTIDLKKAIVFITKLNIIERLLLHISNIILLLLLMMKNISAKFDFFCEKVKKIRKLAKTIVN